MRLNFRKNKSVNLYWWKYEASENGNFGDEITRLIIEANFKKKVHWTDSSSCDIFGTGSIMDVILQSNNESHPYIWGSGFIRSSNSVIDYNNYKIVLVRGKNTLSRIVNLPKDIPMPLGDPGLLANTLLKDELPKKYTLGIIPHYEDMDQDLVNTLSFSKNTIIIDPLLPCVEVLKQVSQCEAILSSSLHGLIVSDSLNVPNAHIQLSDRVVGGTYKFQDYYSAFEESRYTLLTKEDISPLTSEEITSLIQEKYIEPKDLSRIQRDIIKAFPY